MTDLPELCPRCGHRQTTSRPECEKCGVLFAKASRGPRPRPRVEDQFEPGFLRMVVEPRRLFVSQFHRHWWEILLNWEQRNEYSVSSGDGRLVGWIVEQGTGVLAALKRVFLGSHRPLEVVAVSTEKEILLELKRPFFWLFSHMEVLGPAGQSLGAVQRRFSFLHRRYDLLDDRGRQFARIVSRHIRIWTFEVVDTSGRTVGVITKKWSGLGKEYWTDADDFGVDFGEKAWTPAQRAVLLAATIAIDFDFFENNQNR